MKNKVLIVLSLMTVGTANPRMPLGAFAPQHVTPIMPQILAQDEVLDEVDMKQPTKSFLTDNPVVKKLKKDPIIKGISEIAVDEDVKEFIRSIMRKEKDKQTQTSAVPTYHEQFDEMITNQRVIIALLAVLTTKFVVYDIYMQQKKSKE